jgi:8-oxo-dGTP pyrophosphatase MutT (NUDIX family)
MSEIKDSIRIEPKEEDVVLPTLAYLNFKTDVSITHHDMSLALYRQANPQTHLITTGIAVFARSSTGVDHLLLVQRSPKDSHPNCWEIPGGSVDDTGETVLEGAARELWEETGLRVSRFVRELEVTRFSTGKYSKRWWDKPTFEAEVFEAEAEAGPRKGGLVFSEMARVGSKIRLDENEHQAWVWATEQDIRELHTGEVPLRFVNEKQQCIMLEGFARRKASPPSSEQEKGAVDEQRRRSCW